MTNNEDHLQAKKRQTPKWRHQQVAHKNENLKQIGYERERRLKVSGQDFPRDSLQHNEAQDPDGIETRRAKGSQAPRTFSQPSVLCSGDKGIFVTTDMGREKKGLLEFAGLVEEFLELPRLAQSANHQPSRESSTTNHALSGFDDNVTHPDGATKISSVSDVEEEDEPELDHDIDIEATIKRELSQMNDSTATEQMISRNPGQRSKISTVLFQLITLDIPCVSFLRFHPQHPAFSSINTVNIVHSICDEAMRTGQMRSRYIRRLSPIEYLAKTLGGGLIKCCDMTLPPHFVSQHKDDDSDSQKQVLLSTMSFAIRPTVRNNDKLPRDEIIRYIANQIEELGKKRYRVDLKNYDKGVLVEVYRNWIGMSVVSGKGNSSETTTDADKPPKGRSSPNTTKFEYGYEQLKRFNLAEIYTHGPRGSDTVSSRIPSRKE